MFQKVFQLLYAAALHQHQRRFCQRKIPASVSLFRMRASGLKILGNGAFCALSLKQQQVVKKITSIIIKEKFVK